MTLNTHKPIILITPLGIFLFENVVIQTIMDVIKLLTFSQKKKKNKRAYNHTREHVFRC